MQILQKAYFKEHLSFFKEYFQILSFQKKIHHIKYQFL